MLGTKISSPDKRTRMTAKGKESNVTRDGEMEIDQETERQRQ